MIHDMICITCPTGCRLRAEMNEDGSVAVTGNRCKRGVEFARTELGCPTRSLTTTVRTSYGGFPVLPVRTNGEIPKSMIKNAMKTLAEVVADAPLVCGDTVLEDLCGTGVRVIAASSLPPEG